MRTRSITCINENNISATFGERSDSPLILEEAEGLYQMDASLSVSDNAMMDGGTYQSGWMKTRNIVLTIRDRGTADHVSVRSLLFTLFGIREKGTLTVTDTDGESTASRKIDYYTESIESDGVNSSRTYSVSLMCPDPYFYDLTESKVQMSTWLSAFEFEHEFSADGEEFGYKSAEKLKTIQNDQGSDSTGVTITITASGTVKNPQVSWVESNEWIKLGSTSKPLTLSAGDVVTITTHSNNKHIYLTSEGVQTEINQYLTMDSTFVTLHRGRNTIGYSADSGIDMMSVEVTWQMRYTSA